MQNLQVSRFCIFRFCISVESADLYRKPKFRAKFYKLRRKSTLLLFAVGWAKWDLTALLQFSVKQTTNKNQKLRICYQSNCFKPNSVQNWFALPAHCKFSAMHKFENSSVFEKVRKKTCQRTFWLSAWNYFLLSVHHFQHNFFCP